MTETITEVGLLPSNLTEDRGIVNTFNGQVATIEQQHDLLTFRAVGKEATET